MQKSTNTIALIGQRATPVGVHIILRVVHADMVSKVRLWRLSHERAEYPRDVIIEYFMVLFEKLPMRRIVQHQRIRSHEKYH